MTGIHVSHCQEKSTKSSWRSRERIISLIRIRGYATVPLGFWFLLSAEPDIHLLSETPKSPHRRLSLCSLPVPKQTERGLGSCLRRPARHLRDLAACAPNDPDVLYSQGRFFTLPRCLQVARRAQNPVFCARRRACRQPSSWLRQALPCSCSLSVVRAHKPVPAHGCIEEPVSQPPPVLAECACSSAWRWAFGLACRQSSSLRCRVRNSRWPA